MFDHALYQPLAARLRPTQLTEFFGQQHLMAPDKPLYNAIIKGHLHSMILWGPPGTGKTTLAKLMAQNSAANFESLSAVLSGVKEIREVVERARGLRRIGQLTVLFVDEVHRFNKAQQDAFLPHVEDGTITFIGATTENPSFELNNALLSRARVYVLKALTEQDMLAIIERALNLLAQDKAPKQIIFPDALRQQLAKASDGDARQCLNLMEITLDQASETHTDITVSQQTLIDVLSQSLRRFDKQSEAFYDQISALHKSVRGSSVDAALYWLARMLDGGCDPLYIARRLVRMAMEDVGNADPRALHLALDAWHVVERLGSPEGDLALAQTVIYLAAAAKSNAIEIAFNLAKADAQALGSLEVPLHLRNAPTQLMKQLGYAKQYRYAHDWPNAYVPGEQYFPDGMAKKSYYQPTDRGLEIKIKEKLQWLQQLDSE